MRKLLVRIHRWLAVPLGIVLSVICLSGASLVFEKEITRSLDSRLYYVKPEGDMLSSSVLAARIREQVSGSLEIASVRLPEQAGETAMVTFNGKGKSRLSVNPYTGEVIGWTKSYPFFQTMRKLHRWLLDSPARKGGQSVGKLVVGISTLAMVFVLVSGLFIWIPRTRKALGNRLQVSFTKGWRRFCYDAHVSLGFYALLFLLLMALTGLTWSFGWYRTFAYGLFEGILPAGESPKAFFYAVHTGTWGGTITQVLYFLAALVGGTLPLTGYYLWWKKQRRKPHR